MYKKTTLLLLLVTALLTACQDKKEEDCVAPAIGQNIIATWQTPLTYPSAAGFVPTPPFHPVVALVRPLL